MAAKSFLVESISRIVWGGCALIVLAVFIWLGPYPWFRPIFGVALACLALTALWEFYKMATKRQGTSLPILFSLACGLFYLLIHYLQTERLLNRFPHPSLVALGVILFALFTYHCALPKKAIGSLSASFFGIAYIVIPLAWALDLFYRTADGRWWLSFVIGVTVLTDVGAYLFGKLLGRHHPWPKLSPRKTVEGFIGGLIFGAGAAAAAVPFWGPISYPQAVWLGLILAVVGQIGDLSESLLKRDAGVKDSNSLPGLGGALDVVDSLLFNIPTALLALQFI